MLSYIDWYNRKIEKGSIVRIPKYGRHGNRVGKVVRIQSEFTTVKLENQPYFWKKKIYKVLNFDVIRWELEDRI